MQTQKEKKYVVKKPRKQPITRKSGRFSARIKPKINVAKEGGRMVGKRC